MNALPVGTRLGEFELTRTLGDGGFGIVYLAWDHSLERSVALKEYMPSSIAARQGGTEIKPFSERHQDTFDTGMRSFINEAKLLARFDHPALVKVYRFWEANGTAYMVMPFYEGKTLRDTVRARGEPPDEAWLLGLLAPLLDALAVLHANQCYHRDIAPDNIILLAESGRPLLLDFGAARRVIGETTQALTAILKPGYAPVEQYAEVPGLKQGGWTDVYALAAVVHWAITGKTPPNSVSRMFSDTYQPLAEAAAGRYSAGFLAAIDRALAVLPDDRTQSVGALRMDLGLDDAERTVAAPPAAWADPDATVLHPALQSTPPPPPPTGRAATGVPSRPPIGQVATAAPSRFSPPTRPPTGGQTAGTLPPTTAGSAAPPPVRPTTAAGRPPAATPAPVGSGGRDGDDATVIAPPAPLPQPPARPASGDAKRRFPLVPAVAVAVLGGGAALWWALQKSPPAGAPSAAGQPSSAPSAAASSPPSSVGASAVLRDGTAATGTETPAQQPSAAASAVVPVPSLPTSPASASASASSRSSTAASPTGASTPGAAPRLPAAASAARGRPEVPARAASRPAATAARADGRDNAAAGANRAECARILQQLSLGDSSPELFARGQALGCR